MMPSQKLGIERPDSATMLAPIVDERALLHRRDDARRDADREARRIIAMTASWMVTGSFSRDQVQHRLVGAQRDAEVALQRLQPGDVLDGIGSFSRYFARSSAMHLGSRSSPAMARTGSPGSSFCSDEDEDRDQEQGRDRDQSRRPMKVTWAIPAASDGAGGMSRRAGLSRRSSVTALHAREADHAVRDGA